MTEASFGGGYFASHGALGAGRVDPGGEAGAPSPEAAFPPQMSDITQSIMVQVVSSSIPA